MSLDAAIDGLRAVVTGLAGMKRVYADPPESISEFPSAIVYVSGGELNATASGGHNLHTLVVTIFHARQVLAQAVDASKVWPDLVYAALKADMTLGGTVSHVNWPVTYKALPLEYNGVVHYGMRFEVPVKINEGD